MLNRRFIPVLMTYFIDNFGLAIVYPIFTPLFLSPHKAFLGADFTLFQKTFFLGLLIASFPLAQIIGAPLFGGLSDWIGRKKVFLITLSGGVFGYLLTGLGIHFKELPLLWIGRILAGFFSGNLTLCLAAIVDVSVEEKEKSRHFGLVGTIGGLGFIFAILSGGGLATLFHPEIPFFFTSLLLTMNLLLMHFLFQEQSPNRSSDQLQFILGFQNIWKVLQIKGVRIFYVVYFLYMVSWFTSMQFLSAYLIDIYPSTTPLTITLTFCMIGLTWSVANFVLNPLLTRIVPSTNLFLTSLLCVGLFFFFTLIPNQPRFLFLAHFLFATLFAALCWTNGLVTLSESGRKGLQGSLLGVNQSIVALALIVGPLTGSLLAGMAIQHLYLFTSCMSFGAAFLFSRKP